MIIPGTTLIITQYQLASFFKLTNKLLGLVPFYVAWVIPFSTFMIKGYIESIPREFDEAVYMDGGSVFTVFFKVICPLASPAIASVSIFNFLTAWGGIPVGADRPERHAEAHAADRHLRLFRPAPVYAVGLRLRHVRGESAARAHHLHLLPEIFRFRFADRRYQRITNSIQIM